MLWSCHILVSFVMAIRACCMRPTRTRSRSKNRGTQNFELLHNGLLTLFLEGYRAPYLRS
ncbi:unnamed protein product [Callosobruchus maculatus]|uniref:Uncharacterized protein n=1 Tax=Callosobruchus maculatus TaxID=64391 RepID=A0A653DZI8_CALMS|nr:unnamed protein product [Callosobruchus maculatus]